MIKFVQTSDVHLGAKLTWAGVNSKTLRKMLCDAFESTIDKAIEKKVDIFIIVGDLFDSPFPQKALIDFVSAQINKLSRAGIRTIITPGNHDRLETGSVYKKNLQTNDHLYVFSSPEASVFEFNDLDLEVYSEGIEEQFSQKDQLSELSQMAQKSHAAKKICLLHAGTDIGQENGKNAIVNREQIEKSGFDYIAMGDWHGILDVSSQETKAWYAGSPEILARDQKNAGYCIYGEIEREVIIEKHRVGKLNSESYNLKIGELRDTAVDIQNSLANFLTREANKFLIANIKLDGIRRINDKIDTQLLVDIFGEKFFCISIEDKTKLEITREDLSKFPEELLVGRFIRAVEFDINKSTDPVEISILEEILQEGIQRITSRKNDN